MTDPGYAAGWRTARQWQDRARLARPVQARQTGGTRGPRLFLTWLAVGATMLVAALSGLFLLLAGWLMLPLLQRRMRKQAEALRARHARDIGGFRPAAPASSDSRVVEGDYLVSHTQKP